MPLSDLCLEISLYYCTKARTNSLPIYSFEGVKQFQMSKQVDRQGKKVQTIKEFSSFFNEVQRAICHFKPNWFDSHQAQHFRTRQKACVQGENSQIYKNISRIFNAENEFFDRSKTGSCHSCMALNLQKVHKCKFFVIYAQKILNLKLIEN